MKALELASGDWSEWQLYSIVQKASSPKPHETQTPEQFLWVALVQCHQLLRRQGTNTQSGTEDGCDARQIDEAQWLVAAGGSQPAGSRRKEKQPYIGGQPHSPLLPIPRNTNFHKCSGSIKSFFSLHDESYKTQLWGKSLNSDRPCYV